MNKQAIIYSPFNLDSCFAAVIYKELAFYKGKEVSMFPYTRSKANTLPSGANEIIVTGADLSPASMTILLDNNADASISIQAYPNSELYGSKLMARIKDAKNNQIWYSRFDNAKESDDVSTKFTPCVSMMAISAAKGNDYFDPFLTDYADLALIIHKYCTFDSLDAKETYLLNDKMKHIEEAVCEKPYMPFSQWHNRLGNNEEYDYRVRCVRIIIEDNMSIAWYPGSNGSGLKTPTISVASADAMLAMRFINYSHDDVISYEDIKDSRVYRIHSERNLDWYMKRFEPTDVWSEGSLVFLKTELPRHVR